MPITTVNNATYTSTTFPLAHEHFWDISPEMPVVMLGARKSPFLTMLLMGLGLPTKQVTDRVYTIFEDHPQERDIYVFGDDAAGGNTALTTTLTTLHLTNIAGTITDARALVRVGDHIFVHSFQTNQTAADGTVAALGEEVKVVAVDSAGTFITVARNFGSSATTANVTAASNSALQAKIMNPAVGETDSSRIALTHGILESYNYIENFEESFTYGDDWEDTKKVGENPSEREESQKLYTILSKIEDGLLLNRWNLTRVDGVPIYKTQGAIPMILGETTTYAAYNSANDFLINGASQVWSVGNKGNLTLSKWLEFIERVYAEGGDNKVLLCGGGFITTWLQNLIDYITIQVTTNTGQRIGFGWSEWEHSYGAPLKIVRAPSWKGPHFYDALLLDMDHVGLRYFGSGGATKANGPLHIWNGKGNAGLQDPDQRITKKAWAGSYGLYMDYKKAHVYLRGVVNDDGTKGGLLPSVGTNAPSTVYAN